MKTIKQNKSLGFSVLVFRKLKSYLSVNSNLFSVISNEFQKNSEKSSLISKNKDKISVIPESSFGGISGIYKILKEKLFNRIQGRFLFSIQGHSFSVISSLSRNLFKLILLLLKGINIILDSRFHGNDIFNFRSITFNSLRSRGQNNSLKPKNYTLKTTSSKSLSFYVSNNLNSNNLTNYLKTKDYKLKTTNNSKSLSFYVSNKLNSNKLTNSLSTMLYTLKPRKSRFAGFSLVELITSISILTVISIIGFTYANSYKHNQFNSRRISDISHLVRTIDNYKHVKGKYPLPSGNRQYYDREGVYAHSSSGAHGVSGFVTDKTFGKEFLAMLPQDPEGYNYYTYGLTINNKQSAYQFAGSLNDSGYYYAWIKGNYLGDQTIASTIKSYNSNDFVVNKSPRYLPYNPKELMLVGKIISYSGTVSVNGDSYLLDKELSKNDVVEVSTGGLATIKLSDGSILKLGSNNKASRLNFTNLEYKQESNIITDVMLKLSFGEIWVKAPELELGSSLVVETDNTAASVRGTVFGIDYDNSAGSGSIGLIVGEIQINSINNDGEYTTFSDTDGIFDEDDNIFRKEDGNLYLRVEEGQEAININFQEKVAGGSDTTISSSGVIDDVKVEDIMSNQITFSPTIYPDVKILSKSSTGVIDITFKNVGANYFELIDNNLSIYSGAIDMNATEEISLTGIILSGTGTKTISFRLAQVRGSGCTNNVDNNTEDEIGLNITSGIGLDYTTLTSEYVREEDEIMIKENVYSFYDYSSILNFVNSSGIGSMNVCDNSTSENIIYTRWYTRTMGDGITHKKFYSDMISIFPEEEVIPNPFEDVNCINYPDGANIGRKCEKFLVAYAPYDVDGDLRLYDSDGGNNISIEHHNISPNSCNPVLDNGNFVTPNSCTSETGLAYTIGTVGYQFTKDTSFFSGATGIKGIYLDQDVNNDDYLKYNISSLGLNTASGFAIEMSVRGGALKRSDDVNYFLFWWGNLYLSMNTYSADGGRRLVTGFNDDSWHNLEKIPLINNLDSLEDNKFYKVIVEYKYLKPKIYVYDGNEKKLESIPSTYSGNLTFGDLNNLYIGTEESSGKPHSSQWNDIIDYVKIYKIN